MAGSSIAKNLACVRENIAKALLRAGRAPDDVKLIAVSKAKPMPLILEALHAGQMVFGENYVQEALEKIDAIPGVEWHFIGSLQTNKVKQIVGRVALIHSVDREKLALEIANAAQAAGTVQDVLLQVHIGDEATKHGTSISEAPALIDVILERPSLRLCGVMALPPLEESERLARAHFAQVREAFESWRRARLGGSAIESFNELSLGTTADYEWAILEGATMVRVGTAIFGERDPES